MLTKKKFDYKWIILALCFLMNFVCLGFCSGNKGLYLPAITEALGIKRSLFSINDSFRYVSTALINLFFGSLVMRFGFRKMTGFGFVCLIGSMLTYALAEKVYIFYIGGILLGLGVSFTTTTMTSSIIRRWFTQDIGKYTGIVFAANGVGGALAAQIISPLIYQEGNPFGYRTSYFLVAGAVFITGVIVISLLRERPKDATVSTVAVAKKNTRSTSWSGISYDTLKKRPYFYMCAIGTLLTGFILQGITGVYAAHLKDVGLSAGNLATVASVFSLTLTFSKILVGALYDRFGLRTILLMCQCATMLAFIIMLFINSSGLGLILSIIFAIIFALALPLETLVIPLVVNDLFGSASYDKTLGIMVAMNYTGYALGTPIVNSCYDIFGSYRPAFIAFIIMMPVISILFQLVINADKKDKNAVLATAANEANGN